MQMPGFLSRFAMQDEVIEQKQLAMQPTYTPPNTTPPITVKVAPRNYFASNFTTATAPKKPVS
ncbi:MAG: hypothetical protein ACXVC1_07080 [Tumebacillaceae bacterium]